MAKTKASKAKIEINRIIKTELNKRSMPYVDMHQATFDVARVLGVDIAACSECAARRKVASAIAGRDMPDVDALRQQESTRRKQEKIERRQAWRKAHPRPTYLPGIPSASTLEREIKAFYASWEWKRLSYDVKLERGRACECCGARPPKAVIHTDHVKPIRLFWHLRLDKQNLQVLCEDCNMGKGSRDQTDFRALNAEQIIPEPEPSTDEEIRMDSIRQQLRMN